MTSKLVAEENASEKEASKEVVAYLKHVSEVSKWLDKHKRTEPASSLAGDDAKIPNFPVSQYAYIQINVAISCLESLSRMIIRETKDGESLELPLHGDFALVRNAIDCLSVTLWLLEPVNSKLRLKRRLMIQRDENYKANLWAESMDRTNRGAKRAMDERLVELAGRAGLGNWDPLSKANQLISTTKMLTAIERLHQNGRMSWLATWQFASGHAHGKIWAMSVSHSFDLMEGTETEHGGEFFVTGNFSSLAAALKETTSLLEVSVKKFVSMTKASTTR